MDGKLRTLRESKLYEKQVNKLGDIKYIDEALRILLGAISYNPTPEAFPYVPGFNNIQLAKSDPYNRNGISIPPLRLWFKQIDNDIIELMAIEPYEK